jgi:hypothetical protein
LRFILGKVFFTVLCSSLFSLLVACGGGSGESDTPTVNAPPKVNAGQDQIVGENTEVVVTGVATDSDGSIASYSWTQLSGRDVLIENKDSQILKFLTPELTEDETFTFELTVIDNEGARSSDTVSITVIAQNFQNTFVVIVQFYDDKNGYTDFVRFDRNFRGGDGLNTDVSTQYLESDYSYCWSDDEKSGCYAMTQRKGANIQTPISISKQGHFQESLDLYRTGAGYKATDFLSTVHIWTQDYFEHPEVTTESLNAHLIRLCVEVNTGNSFVDSDTGVVDFTLGDEYFDDIQKRLPPLKCVE